LYTAVLINASQCGRWRGRGPILDVTSSSAVAWFSQRLRRFSRQYGVDSFKFDAGEVDYLPEHWRSAQPLNNSNYYSTLYVNMAATFGRFIEVIHSTASVQQCILSETMKCR